MKDITTKIIKKQEQIRKLEKELLEGGFLPKTNISIDNLQKYRTYFQQKYETTENNLKDIKIFYKCFIDIINYEIQKLGD